MDIGTAIPVSTGIIMTGIGVIKFLRIKNGNGSKPIPNYKERLNNLTNRCDERFGGIIKRLEGGDNEFKDMKTIINRIDKRVAILCDRANIKIDEIQTD